jgi:CubicO group peptidase (beta-lactamase class C family)
MRFGSLAAVTVAALIVAAPAMAQEAAPAPQAQVFAKLSDAEAIHRVEAVIDEMKARPEFVGLSVAVARGDRVLVDRGAGIADLEWNAPADESARFRIGSVTKQFTAAAIMKLAERGKLTLDDPLAKFVPQFDTAGHTATIRQLLNQTSGIPNYTAQPGFAKAMQSDVGEEDVLKLVAGVPFDFDPGMSWRYSNTNYFLLGMVVEKISGRTYAEFMREEFFKPLGLSHTRYGDMRDIIPHRAQGYDYDANTRTVSNAMAISMNWPGGAGGLVSTAGDLVRWQIALTGGRAVSASSFEQMIGSAVDTGDGVNRYGFGLMINQANGHRRVWHNGGINGFNGMLMWLPDDGLGVAVISNVIGLPSDAIAGRIVAELTSEKPLPPLRTTPQPGGEAALRKFIEDQVTGTTDYSTMTQPMADLVKAHPEGQAMFKAWGPIEAITFLAVNLNGTDSYRVDFASGTATIFNLFRTPEGKIAAVNFHPVGPPP